jgi:hypothetical protein
MASTSPDDSLSGTPGPTTASNSGSLPNVQLSSEQKQWLEDKIPGYRDAKRAGKSAVRTYSASTKEEFVRVWMEGANDEEKEAVKKVYNLICSVIAASHRS